MNKRIVIFLPAIAALAVSVVVLSVYLTVLSGDSAAVILQILCAPVVALVLPVVNKLFGIKIPFAVNVVVTVHAVLALDFAKGLDLYTLVPYTDKFLHTYFGFYCALVVFVLLLYFGAEKMNKFGFFLIVLLAVLGVGVLWEIYEFTCDSLFGMDCQMWRATPAEIQSGLTYEQYVASRGNPMSDTMWDLIVTVFGVLIFYLFIFIDKLRGYKLCASIYRQVKGEEKELAQPSNEKN